MLSATGICCVVLGGLVAAVTEPLDLAHGSWLAAYLVLVGGVAQCAMGQARLRRPDLRQPRRGWAQLGCWNVGNALVIAATLAGEPWAVDLGSTLDGHRRGDRVARRATRRRYASALGYRLGTNPTSSPGS